MAKNKHEDFDEDSMAKATRWLPLFIIILMVILVIVYVQSTRITVPEAGPNAEILDQTSEDLSTKLDKSAEKILENFPGMKMTVSSLKESEEEKLSVIDMPTAKTTSPDMTSEALQRIISQKKETSRRAIEVITPDGFINNGDFWISNIIGKKIILLNFWTSSSINSRRQIKHLNDWYKAYKDVGLEVVGIHTPEFGFEQDIEVVRSAVKELGIEYPVILDNKFRTWRAYENKFWPSIYLIDIDGFIIYNKIGDAGCESVEQEIKKLLEERKKALSTDDIIPSGPQSTYGLVDFLKIKTPVIYLGYTKNRGDFGNTEGFTANMPANYIIPEVIIPNSVYLEGEWLNNKENMELLSDTGRLILKYTAKNVHIVTGGKATMNIVVNGKTIQSLNIEEEKLYTIVKGDDYASQNLELQIKGKGLKLYSLSFG